MNQQFSYGKSEHRQSKKAGIARAGELKNRHTPIAIISGHYTGINKLIRRWRFGRPAEFPERSQVVAQLLLRHAQSGNSTTAWIKYLEDHESPFE